MIYSEPLSQQIVVFIKAIGSGIIIGLLYDFICTVRALISKKRSAIIVQDIIFGMSATVFSFFFMVLFNGGEVRLNLVAAQLLGACAFHFTVGKALSSVVLRVSVKVKKILGWIFYPLIYLKERLTAFFGELSLKTKEKFASVKHNVTKSKEKLRTDSEESTD